MHINTHQKNRQHGVSLIEVLIALLVVAVGVLGLAKMQALAVSNTQASGLRGLIALQAMSLGSTMHSDKGYWQVPAGSNVVCSAASCKLSGTSTSSFGAVPSSCLNTTHCTNTQMAAWDVSNWMNQMNTNVPGYTATINCAAGTTLPVTCSIQIVWLEKQTGGGTTTATLADATPYVQQAYYLYVQP